MGPQGSYVISYVCLMQIAKQNENIEYDALFYTTSRFFIVEIQDHLKFLSDTITGLIIHQDYPYS